jgi:hypothetical protein
MGGVLNDDRQLLTEFTAPWSNVVAKMQDLSPSKFANAPYEVH